MTSQTRYRAPLLAGALLLLSGALAAADQTRAFTQEFPAGATVRLANLAGHVEIVPSRGPKVVVEATVHGETRQLIDGIKWVQARDGKGRAEWALSYPVKQHRSFHYPRPDDKDSSSDLPEFLSWLDNGGYSSSSYLGEKVRVYPKKRSGVPTLYVDLKITMPAGADLAVRNVVGGTRGGDLDGTLAVDTGSGDVRIASFAGRLGVDTGSGDVRLGAVRGETAVDTGSGDINVGRLVGNGNFDTGSGDVQVEQVAAGKLAADTGSGNVIVRGGTVARLLADTGSGDVRVLGVEIEELNADTGSGDVTVESSLAQARHLKIGTGSGDVRIVAGPGASFDLDSDQGSGDLSVGYADASLRKDGGKVVGARRGDGRTQIQVGTGSGDCSIRPKG
jgi:Putative adhesin